MGLIDDLYIGHNSSFGGQQGGLLDFLRQTQMQNQQYQPSAGFAQPNQIDAAPWPVGPVGAPTGEAPPVAIGGYQMPRIGGMASFTPAPEDPAALPPNAQPTQGQLPAPMQPMAPQESPGGIGAGLQGFLRNLHTGPIGAIVGGVGSAAGMQDPEKQQQNQTAQFLVSKGMDPAMAKAVVADPALTRAVLPQIMGFGGQTDDIKEFERTLKDPAFAKYMREKRATQGEFSLTPQYGVNEKGETVLIQPGKSGKAAIAELPPGVKVSSQTEKVDSGTHWTIYDKRTGAAIGIQPKDIVGKEAAEEVGKAKGQAEVALPNIIANAEQTLKTIQSVKSDPYRERGTGASSFFNMIPATGGYDFAQKLEQLKGKTFLEAFQQLKGGGAITDIEGKKAENAIARLSPGQSEGAFLEALNELEEVVKSGIERAKVRAGKGGQSTTAPAPATNLKAKYGLD